MKCYCSAIREMGRNNYPDNVRRIFVCLHRCVNKRMAALCNYCYNDEDGRKGKQDLIIISFHLRK